MKRLSDLIKNPSALDSTANYIGEIPDDKWLVVLTQSRDSNILTRSNFQVALNILGGESDNVTIDKFGHWACGWWEALSVVKDSPQYEIALKIESNLADYPVLDDSAFADLEWKEASDYWSSLSLSDRVDLCREHNISIFSARFDTIPENDSGSLLKYLIS